MIRSRRAFTLVEILIVTAMACIIFTAGIAPLMFVVRTMSDTRRQFTADDMERAAFNRMVGDIRDAVLLNQNSPIRISKSEELSDKPRNALIVWSSSPSYQGLPIGSVVYAIPKPNVIYQNEREGRNGLKRLVLSSDIARNDDLQQLFAEGDPTLMIPDLEGITIQALRAADWTDEYTGGIPQAIRVVFEYKDREREYEAWFPNAN